MLRRNAASLFAGSDEEMELMGDASDVSQLSFAGMQEEVSKDDTTRSVSAAYNCCVSSSSESWLPLCSFFQFAQN